MKTKSYLIGLLLLAVGLFVGFGPVRADNDRHSNPAFVEIMYYVRQSNGIAQPTIVYNITACGDGLPDIRNLDLAQAAVLLSRAGLTMRQPVIYGQLIWVRD